MHEVGGDRREVAHRHRRAVIDDEIGEDREIAVGVGDAGGTRLAEARDQLGADGVDVGLGVLAIDRDPPRHRPAAIVRVVGGEMAVAEVLAEPFGRQQQPEPLGGVMLTPELRM